MHPKGTTDEFSTYYDSLSSEMKEVGILEYSYIIYLTYLIIQKWEKLSTEAKELGKTPSECVPGLPVPS